MSPSEHAANMRILEGSFLVEGIVLSEETKSDLQRLACGETTCEKLIAEILQKYKSKGAGHVQ